MFLDSLYCLFYESRVLQTKDNIDNAVINFTVCILN